MNNEKKIRFLKPLLITAIFIVFCLNLIGPIVDPDFFWHLSTGKWISENLRLPHPDPFSYTTPDALSDRGNFILTSYWLSQIIFYGFYYFPGYNGIVLLRFLLLGGLIYLLYKTGKGSDKSILLSVISMTVIVLLHLFPLERPQVFSFIFFGILLYLLKNSRYAFIPPLMLLWANMHGGYILGVGMILLYIFTHAFRFLIPSLNPMDRKSYKGLFIYGLAGIMTSFINPNTYKAFPVFFETPDYMKIMIREYQSTILFFRFTLDKNIILYWFLLLLAVLMVFYRAIKKRFDITEIAMLSGLGYFSFTQLRYIPFLLIWAAPEISGFLSNIPRRAKTGFILIAILLSSYTIKAKGEFDNIHNIKNFWTGSWVGAYYPETAVRLIKKTNLKGNIYNSYDWGGYLIWRLYPENKVFIDGRGLHEYVFAQSMLIDHAESKPEIMGMPFYKATLDGYGVSIIVMPIYNTSGQVSRLIFELIKDKDWRPVIFGTNLTVFVKNTPGNYHVIYKYSIPRDVFIEDLIGVIDRTIKETPRHSSLYITKGELYLSQDRFEEAEEAFKKALEINPLNPTAKERLKFIGTKKYHKIK